jgi:hypothetical protein
VKPFGRFALILALVGACKSSSDLRTDEVPTPYELQCTVNTRDTPSGPVTPQTFTVRSDIGGTQAITTKIGAINFGYDGNGLLTVQSEALYLREQYRVAVQVAPVPQFGSLTGLHELANGDVQFACSTIAGRAPVIPRGQPGAPNITCNVSFDGASAQTFQFTGSTGLDEVQRQVFDRGDVGVTFGYNNAESGGSLFAEPWVTADKAVALESLYQFGTLTNAFIDGTFTGQIHVESKTHQLDFSCTQNDASADASAPTCSAAGAWTAETLPLGTPAGRQEPYTTERCTTRCGRPIGESGQYQDLPSGPCALEGEACRTELLYPCPGAQGRVDGVTCECTNGVWACWIGAPGAAVCMDAGADASP